MELLNKTIKDYSKQLASDLNLASHHVFNALELYGKDNTIPFIARYRKDETGAMDDAQLRELFDIYDSLLSLDERKNTVIKSLNEQEIDDEELYQNILKATKLSEVEDLYRSYKPKKQTRATIALKLGAEPLSKAIKALKSESEIKNEAQLLLDNQLAIEKVKPLETIDEAISAACDILAQEISDDANIRQILKREYLNKALISSTAKVEEDTVFRQYYAYSEPLKRLANHRLLALNRGEAQDILKVSLELEESLWQRPMFYYFKVLNKEGYTPDLLKATAIDSYKRLLKSSLENEIMSQLTAEAHEEALKLFGLNLKNALCVPPMSSRVILALDPGFKNGCKWATVDPTGNVLEAGLIYPVLFKNKLEEAKKTVVNQIKKHSVEMIVLGNGTASRETEEFLSETLKEHNLKIPYLIVDESGASVYSASPISKEELPHLELNLRSAVSLARRVLDPLAELVKIDPKSIGVGQYQHDMNQKRLDQILGGVTEGVVNQVGVSLNTASASLLSYVSGISKSIAKNIVAFREENGLFNNRKQLLKVKSLGPKAYQQCAGFLRIVGKNPLDNTFVHPESYELAQNLIDTFNLKFNHSNNVDETKLENYIKEHNLGTETVHDIIEAISTPERDIRDDFPAPVLISEVKSMEDLKVNQVMTGVVRNVTAFGAFVDLGVHQDGLVHISQMSNKFVKDPTTIVSVGEVVKVRIIEIDVEKHRIALSMKDVS